MNNKFYVAGHTGMVGSAVVRRLQQDPANELILQTRAELDLCDQSAVSRFYAEQKPDVVVFCAARVGGIHANNTYPAEFAFQNLAMATNAIHAAYQNGVKRFLFLGSTCIYPRDCAQPIQEDALLTGPLEQTNEAYALAKIAGLKLCQYYRRQYGAMFHSAMPTNLYGPGDNYHPEHSHVLPALLRRFHEAKEEKQPVVTIWGTGTPRREFLYVDDLADAIVHLLNVAEPPDWVNVGTGTDIPIQQLAELIANVVGYEGQINNDTSKPDGTPVKRTDTTRLNGLGWKPSVTLEDGVRRTYACYLQEVAAQVVRAK